MPIWAHEVGQRLFNSICPFSNKLCPYLNRNKIIFDQVTTLSWESTGISPAKQFVHTLIQIIQRDKIGKKLEPVDINRKTKFLSFNTIRSPFPMRWQINCPGFSPTSSHTNPGWLSLYKTYGHILCISPIYWFYNLPPNGYPNVCYQELRTLTIYRV